MAITKITYEGEATHNSRARGNIKPNGHGKMTCVDSVYEGYRYEGDFVDGKSHGRGKWYRPDGTLEYEGKWRNDNFHGQGKYMHPDPDPDDGCPGYRYEGDFVDGNYHGRGRWYRPDDTLEYEGGFADNNRHGQGKSYRADGTTVGYEGDWMEDTRHGQGTLYHPDGTIERTGTWVHGEPADEAGVD